LIEKILRHTPFAIVKEQGLASQTVTGELYKVLGRAGKFCISWDILLKTVY